MPSDRRRAWLLGVVLILGALVIAERTPAATSAPAPRVAILKSSTIAPFELATEALVASLRDAVPQPEVLTFDLEGDSAKEAAVLETMYAANPRVIVTIGSLATAAATASDAAVPIVFSMVLYPKASGFESSARRGVTGVSLDVPLETQFASVHRLLPRAKRIGVLFHPAETGAIAAAAVAAAAASGLTLVSHAVDETGEAVAALGTLMEQVDAVWTVADGHVLTPQTTPALILAALRRRVPLIGLSTAHVRSGALAALYCDYRDVGAQTGELVQRVLRGERAESIPVASPRRSELAVNQRTAELLGIAIPADVARDAAMTLP